MSTITAPGPSTTGVRSPAKSETAGRRTVLGFVATRRVVEVVLTVILGSAAACCSTAATSVSTWCTPSSMRRASRSPPKGDAEAQPQGVPRPAALRRPEGRQRSQGQGVRQRVHQPPPRGGQRRQDLLAAERGVERRPENAKLAAQVASSFKGETLRGLLLYAWGWSVVSTIALYAAIGALIGFIVMLLVTIGDFVADPKIAAHHISPA